MSTEFLVSITAFIANSLLLSSFIIPQVQKLKEIKDKLVKFQITFIPTIGSVPPNERELRERQEVDVKSLQDLLDIYAIRSGELKPLVGCFRQAIGLVIIAILTVAKWPYLVNTVLIIHAIAQLTLFLVALRIYAVSPDKLQEAGYLVRDLDINPHALVNALDLKLAIDPAGGLFPKRRVQREDPLVISIFPKIRVWGFRFLLVIYNAKEEVFYVAFGPLTSKTKMIRHLPPIDFFGTREFNRVELGRFPFNMIEEKQELKLAFLVFLPFFQGEKCCPYFTEGRHEVGGISSSTFLCGSSLGMWSLTTSRRYEGIEYEGNGINVRTRLVSDAKPHVINDVFRKYNKEFDRTKFIRQYQDIRGGLLLAKDRKDKP